MTRDQIQSKIDEIMATEPVPTTLNDLKTQVYQWLLDGGLETVYSTLIVNDLK